MSEKTLGERIYALVQNEIQETWDRYRAPFLRFSEGKATAADKKQLAGLWRELHGAFRALDALKYENDEGLNHMVRCYEYWGIDKPPLPGPGDHPRILGPIYHFRRTKDGLTLRASTREELLEQSSLVDCVQEPQRRGPKKLKETTEKRNRRIREHFESGETDPVKIHGYIKLDAPELLKGKKKDGKVGTIDPSMMMLLYKRWLKKQI